MDNLFPYHAISFTIKRFGNQEAVYDYDSGQHYTYRQMEQRAQRLSRYLTEELHLVKGDCIAFCSSNTTAFLDALISGYDTGIIITTYNPRLTVDELLVFVQKESPKVLFFEDIYVQKAKLLAEKADIAQCISLFHHVDLFDCVFYDEILETQKIPYEIHCPLNQEDIQMYIHTGGTTGLPKTAMLSYRCTFFNAVGAILSDGLTSQDSTLIFLPFFHTSGWNVLTIPLLFCGGRIILKRKYDCGEALQIIRKERPSVALALPTIFQSLSEHPDFTDTDFTCFRWISNGGTPPVQEAMEKFWDKGVTLVNGYGMTEIGPNNLKPSTCGRSLEETRACWNSVGVPGYFNLVKIIDEEGCEVSRGEKGELCFKGPLTFSGYLNDPEATHAIVRDGWVSTGDIGWQDEAGCYHISGRRKNMFISGGENIFPFEIETILRRYPEIKDVCVIGIPDAKWGEVGKMILVTEPNFSLPDFLQFIRIHLPSIKRPCYCAFAREIPVNDNGKPDYQKIYTAYRNTEGIISYHSSITHRKSSE